MAEDEILDIVDKNENEFIFNDKEVDKVDWDRY